MRLQAKHFHVAGAYTCIALVRAGFQALCILF
jgi:hypothetical protein